MVPPSPAERRFMNRNCRIAPCGGCEDAQTRLRCAAKCLHEALDAAEAAFDSA